MGHYLLRRLLIAMPSLLGISVVLFTVLALAPGDPFEELAPNPNVPPEVRPDLRKQFGLDDPVWQRYFRWLAAMLQGDWGFSFVSRVDVDTLILQRVPVTLAVIGASQLLALLIALPVGIYSATRPYSLFDQIANTLAFIGFSLPTFFTGLLFILLFSIKLDWLPFVYRADIAATGWRWWWEHFKQAIMPVLVLGLFQGASWTRYVRSAVLDVIRLDYVTTARTKGLRERVVIMKHVVRNALIPVVTLVALQMPAVFGGAIVTEQIFRVPGIGSLLINAILRNDTPVIMAVTFVFSLPRHPLQPDRRPALWLARPPHQLPLAPRRRRPRRAGAASRRRPRPGGASAATSWRWPAWSCWSLMVLRCCFGPLVWKVAINEIDFTARLKTPIAGASVRHRRPRPGPLRAHALRRPHLARGRAWRRC